MRHKTPFAHTRQWRHAREDAVLIAGNIQQHHRQGGLIKVLGIAGTHPYANSAAPVSHLRQLGAEKIQQRLCLAGVVVGDVEQAQRGRMGVAGQRHLRAQLCQHQGGSHAPLRMCGMAGGAAFHGMPGRVVKHCADNKCL